MLPSTISIAGLDLLRHTTMSKAMLATSATVEGTIFLQFIRCILTGTFSALLFIFRQKTKHEAEEN